MVPFPEKNDLAAFLFIFTIEGSYDVFLKTSKYMDRVVSSFRWPAEKPNRPIELLNHALNLVNIGSYNVAIEHLEEAIKLNKRFGDAYITNWL